MSGNLDTIRSGLAQVWDTQGRSFVTFEVGGRTGPDADRWIQYLDGELTVWRRRAITRHLDECPPCAQGFTFEIELRRIVVSKCHEEVPAELRTRIAQALQIDI